MSGKWYRLGSVPSADDLSALDVDRLSAKPTIVGVSGAANEDGVHVMAQRTGNLKTPKAGQWYLDKGVAYRAERDVQPHLMFEIAKLVLVERTTKVITKRVSP